MSNAYIMDMNGVGEPSGYTVRALLQFGDNDDDNYSDNELLLGGSDPSDYVGGEMAWNPDTNADGSWDSGWVPVDLTLLAGGGTNGVDLSVLGANPGTLANSGLSYQYIDQVDLTAGVQTQGSFQWGDVSITFRNAAGAVVDSYSSASGPAVDTSSASDANAAAEQVLVVTANPGVQATSATIDGQVRMSTPHGPNVNDSDLFGEILVFTGPT